MNTTNRTARGRLVRALGILVVVLTLAGPIISQPMVSAAQESGGLTELWTFETADALTTDPVVADGVVYVTSEDGIVHAVDAATGTELWQAPTSMRSFRPDVAAGLLFTLELDEVTESGRLIALDIASEGKEERWAFEFAYEDGVPTGRLFGIEEGVLLVNLFRDFREAQEEGEEDTGVLSSLVVLDLEDGTERWRLSPATASTTGDGAVFVRMAEGLVAVDIVSGEQRWVSEEVGGFYADGVLYGYLPSDGIVATDGESGEVLWRAPLDDADGLGPIAIAGGALYFSDNRDDGVALLAFDLERQEARWMVDELPGWLAGFGADDEFVYLPVARDSADLPGGLFVLDAASRETVAQADLPSSALTVTDGVIYAGDDEDVLHAFQAPGDADFTVGPAGQTAGSDAPLDLAAITLIPDDLARIGLAGYAVGFGQTIFPDETIVDLAEGRDIPEDEVREILVDAGFVRRYYNQLYLPEDETDPAGLVGRMVVSYVLEFAGEDGAAAAWEVIEDESISGTTEDLTGVAEFGDQSEATRDRGEDADTGDQWEQLDLTFQLGSLHAGVAIIDWTGEEPDLADVEALAERLLERIEEAQVGGTPGLGVQVSRLTGDAVVPSADYYILRDGEALPIYGEATDVDARADAAADIGQTDSYRLWQQVYAGEEEPGDDVWYLVDLRRFAGEDVAAGWLAGAPARIEGNDAFADFAVDEAMATAGDESIAYTVARCGFRYRGVTLRVGSTVAVIDVYGPEPPTAPALEALAEAQAACLEDGGCIEPMLVPNDLQASPAADPPFDRRDPPAPDAPPDAASDDGDAGDDSDTEEATASPDDSPAAGETYASPTWDYAVRWDPETWVGRHESKDDGIEFNIMGSFAVMVAITGVADYDGDPEACLAGMVEAAGRASPLVPTEDLPAPATSGDAVGGLYDSGTLTVYYECRTLAPGEAVLQIRFATLTRAYETALPALEELLAGIEVE